MTVLDQQTYDLTLRTLYRKAQELLQEGQRRGTQDHTKRFLRQCLLQYPSDPAILTNLAALCYNDGEDDQAQRYIQQALATPEGRDNAGTRYTLSQIQLKAGHWEAGWSNYEYRFLCGAARNVAPLKSRWLGEPLEAGQWLTLWNDQGFGDAIQMARFLPAVRHMVGDGKVRLVVHESLVPLLDGMVDEVVSRCVLQTEEIHCPLFSLPHLLRISPGRLSGRPYLPRPETGEYSGPLRVGFCWESSHAADEVLGNRSIPAHYLPSLFAVEGIARRTLQYGVDDFLPKDFGETARAVAGCDLVVTVDTSIVHLAGAMGIPTWLLLRYQGDFRWLSGRCDTPWYDSVRLYRQPRKGDWASVLLEVKKDLMATVEYPPAQTYTEPTTKGCLIPTPIAPVETKEKTDGA